MPYINIERRCALDTITDGLIKRLQSLKCKRGDLNYIVTRLVVECLNQDSYHSLSDCVSVLRDAADEIARRLLGPYEDTAILRNGDMMCFQRPYAYRPLDPEEDLSNQAPDPNRVDGQVVVDSPLQGWPHLNQKKVDDACANIKKNIHDAAQEVADEHQAQRVVDLDMSNYCNANPGECEGSGPTDD